MLLLVLIYNMKHPKQSIDGNQIESEVVATKNDRLNYAIEVEASSRARVYRVRRAGLLSVGGMLS